MEKTEKILNATLMISIALLQVIDPKPYHAYTILGWNIGVIIGTIIGGFIDKKLNKD